MTSWRRAPTRLKTRNSRQAARAASEHIIQLSLSPGERPRLRQIINSAAIRHSSSDVYPFPWLLPPPPPPPIHKSQGRAKPSPLAWLVSIDFALAHTQSQARNSFGEPTSSTLSSFCLLPRHLDVGVAPAPLLPIAARPMKPTAHQASKSMGENEVAFAAAAASDL